MTTPGGYYPDDAITDDDLSGLNGLDEATWRSNLNGSVIGSYNDASQAYLQQTDDISTRLDDLEDAQTDMTDRTDLLEDASSYGQLYLTHSWNVPSGWHRLPFDGWIGPRKGVSTFFNDGADRGMMFDTKGLWRVDAEVTFDAPPSNWFTGAVVAVITCRITIGDEQLNILYSVTDFELPVSSYGGASASWAKTVVIPEDGRYSVSVELHHDNSSTVKLRGGTALSSLSVNKWETGTGHDTNIDNPPDGGTL